jgi:predicted TIM-barrel fold metal-dependent hydrolase
MTVIFSKSLLSMLPNKFIHVFITNELRGKVAINILLKGAYLDRELLRALRASYFKELHVFQRFANPYSYHQEVIRVLRILDKANVPIVVNSELMRDLAVALFNDPYETERVQKELNLRNLRVVA